MQKEYGSVKFLSSIKDTFPYVESAIYILDNNLNWWKQNSQILEEIIANEARGIANSNVEIVTRFTIYSGTDDVVKSVKWTGPAIEFNFIETSNDFVNKIKESIGTTWQGHRVLTEDNKLYIMFE